jgi:hypothetical protein
MACGDCIGIRWIFANEAFQKSAEHERPRVREPSAPQESCHNNNERITKDWRDSKNRNEPGPGSGACKAVIEHRILVSASSEVPVKQTYQVETVAGICGISGSAVGALGAFFRRG